MLKDRNILLVEDEMLVAMMLEMVLEDEGCNVVTAGYLEQAKHLANEMAIDAAVLDVNLHGKLSYPVADVLTMRGIPFVFVSGYGDVELKSLYPGRLIVPKPYQPDKLVKVLSSLIAG